MSQKLGNDYPTFRQSGASFGDSELTNVITEAFA